jgi:hypothetical protein
MPRLKLLLELQSLQEWNGSKRGKDGDLGLYNI